MENPLYYHMYSRTVIITIVITFMTESQLLADTKLKLKTQKCTEPELLLITLT